MIPPQELKNKSFSHAARGYEIAEVDEYIDFVIGKYSEIFAQCAKYDKKLRVVSARIAEIQQEEELIRRLSVSTQKNCDRLTAEAEEEAKNIILKARETAEHILGEARESAQTALALIEQKALMQIESTQKKSDALLSSARTRCAKLLGDFKKEISVQCENIAKVKGISEEFNSKLLAMYKNHLNLLSENTSIPNLELEKFSETGLYESVMREIKNDAVEIAKKNTGVEYDFESELESLRVTKAAISDLEMELELPEKPLRKPKPEEKDEEEEDDEDEEEEEVSDGPDEPEEDDEDGDLKIYDKAAPPKSVYTPPERKFTENPYARTYGDDSGDDEGFEEKPVATYDSDDYVYGGSSGAYESSADLGLEDEAEDEELEPPAKSKGFFGLFKKKPPKGSKKQAVEDDNEDSMDIFEDLDEE